MLKSMLSAKFRECNKVNENKFQSNLLIRMVHGTLLRKIKTCSRYIATG